MLMMDVLRGEVMKQTVTFGIILMLVFLVAGLVFAKSSGLGHGLVLGGSGLEYSPFGDDRWHPCDEWGTKGPDLLVSRDDAKKEFEDRLLLLRNPDLKLGEIVEYDEYYEAEILTKNNIPVETLRKDKDSCANY